MLSVTIDKIEGYDVGKHPLVLRVMKGIFNLNPPSAKYCAFWDVNIVLSYLASLGPNAELPFDKLSSKLAMLLALTSMCRVSELAAIDFDSITVNDSGVRFALSKPRKNQHRGPLKTFLLTRLPEDNLTCPVACMSAYLIKSYDFRSDLHGKTLLLALRAPHKSVGASTVARWIKGVLVSAGIDVNKFSSHSTRGASASKAFAAGIPVERILKAGGWASESVFSKHYQRPIGDQESDGLVVTT
jgi:integrase